LQNIGEKISLKAALGEMKGGREIILKLSEGDAL
jgi:hypothetical protein